jgi:hypothetical protein
MTDIVERLKQMCEWGVPCWDDIHDARAEIEKLQEDVSGLIKLHGRQDFEHRQEVERLNDALIHQMTQGQLYREEIERFQEALSRCLDLMNNGGTWNLEEQKRFAALATKEKKT